jgi:hypothetical protein
MGRHLWLGLVLAACVRPEAFVSPGTDDLVLGDTNRAADIFIQPL